MSIKTVQATVGGQTVTLTLNASTGKYEATLTASSDSSFNQTGGYFPVSVKATNIAGTSSTADSSHATLGQSLRLFVAEKVKPTVQITSPTTSAFVINSTPNISFKVLDNSNGQSSGYSGVNKSSLVLKINGSAVDTSSVTWSDTSGGYIGTYTPSEALPEGSNTVTVDISDNDGNKADQASVSFVVDTIAPTLIISAPSEGLVTNNPTLIVSGQTDDATSKPVSVTVKLGSSAAEDAAVNSDGTFSKSLTLAEGENVIVITAKDRAGKETVITRNVTLDTSAPVIKSVEIKANGKLVTAANPVAAGTTYTITVEVE